MKFLKDIFIHNSFLQNVTKLLSANVLVQIIAFLLSTIITRIYTPIDFSHLAVFMSVAGFFIIFSTLRLEFAFILPKDDKDAKSLVKISFFIAIIVSLLSFLFIVIFNESINKYYKINLSSIWWYGLPLLVFFTASFNILINYFNRLKNYNKQAIAQGVLGVSNPVTAIIIGANNLFKFGLIHSVIFANLLSSIFMYPIILKDKIFASKFNFKLLKKYYQFPIFNTPHALVNFVSNNLPVFILTPVFGDIAIGLLTMAIGKVFKPINILGNSIYQVLSKKIVDDIHNNKNVSKNVFKLLKSQFLTAIIPFVLLLIFAPKIFSFVWGKDWIQAGVYLQYLIPWLFMTYMNSTLTFIPNLFFKQKEALFLELVHTVLRFLALSFGVYKNNIYIAISLFSLVGFVMLSINLIWYISILKNHDSKILSK